MFLITYATAVLAIVFFVSAGALLRSRTDALGRMLGWYALAGAVWIGGNAVADVSYSPLPLILASGIAFTGGAATLFCFLLLVDTVIDRRLPSPGRIGLYASPNVLVSLFAFSPFAIAGVAFPPGAPAQIIPGPLYTVSLFLLLAGFGYGVVRLWTAVRRTTDPARKMQILYCLVGLLVMLAGELTFDVVLPLSGEFRFYSLGPMSSLAFGIECGYAVLRHKLIDLRLVVRTLERKVEERTREIRALQEEQRRMIFDLSHSLQTPLAILKTKVERMDRVWAREGDVASLEQSVDSLSSFVNDLLSLATLDQLLQEEAREIVPLSELVCELAEEIAVIAEGSNIRVLKDIRPNVRIRGTRKRLTEAVMSLASNSIKYMGSGPDKEIRLTVSVRGPEALLAITDTGIGIAESEVPHVFERFYRAGNRVYGRPEGTGLGLAVVERIVKSHCGRVEIQSALGSGTSVTLAFPRCR